MISNFVLNTYTNIIFCQSDDKSKYDCAYRICKCAHSNYHWWQYFELDDSNKMTMHGRFVNCVQGSLYLSKSKQSTVTDLSFRNAAAIPKPEQFSSGKSNR